MLSIKRALLILLAFAAMPAGAQQVLTLEQVIQRIEQNNPALQAFDSQAKSQDARVAGAKAWMAPMVGAGTYMTPYPGVEVMDDGDRGAMMFSAEQEIPNPSKVRAKSAYLQAQSQIRREARGAAENDLRASAKQLYFDLLIAHKKIRLQKENQQIMATMRKLAEIRYPLNQAGLNSVFKAEGRSYEAENMVLMTESEIRSKKIALNALMNRAPQETFEIDTSYKVVFIPAERLDTTYLANSRSDIQQMDRSIQAMALNIDQMRQEAKPDFKIRFDHMSPRSNMMPRQYTVMGMVSIPIAPWSSKMYKAEVKSMGFEIEGMARQREAMLNQMLGMAKSMETELLVMQKQLGNYEQKILPALQKNLRVSMLSYQENKLDLAAVIDSWEAINMAQMNYLDQVGRFYKMVVEYERSIQK